MFSSKISFAAVLGLAAVANAHFQMSFPAPRGVFVEDNEPNFCDGYNNAVDNRTAFPLSGGFISLNSEHPKWTIGVLISTKSNPTSFNDFNSASGAEQIVLPFQQENVGEGHFCLPLDLSSMNMTGVQDGMNVTLQVVFDGGDGQLYQCADLTLSSNASIPAGSDDSCKNLTVNAAASSTATAAAGSTATAPVGAKSGARTNQVAVGSALLALVAAAFAAH